MSFQKEHNIMKSELRQSLETGFIDKAIPSYAYFQPKLIVNDKKQKKKILSTLLYELNHCKSFVFSVAFLSKSGVAVIINTLDELRVRGIKGEVLVSQYLNFTQPEALKTLMQFDNIDLRIVTHGDFHAKGYFFKHENHNAMIVGSSNLTAPALTTNKEWNLYVCAMDESKLIEDSLVIFYDEFHKAQKVDTAYINYYENVYKYQVSIALVSEKNVAAYAEASPIVLRPNSMQEDALRSLMKLRSASPSINKAMIISATGTGKTFLSVFDAQNFNPKRLLFVVHRANIAKKAMESYKRVFGNYKSMGLFSGFHKQTNEDFVFSTIQTLSKDENLKIFKPDDFDYLVIDESHHVGADTYQKILSYFKPKFLLGMTATPERTDGYNVFADFDHNIAFEVRLNRALDEGMLSPFHYYGVTDLSIEEENVKTNTSFLNLTSDEKVNQIIEKSKFYGTDSGNVYGLVFCNEKRVARELSKKFNAHGYKTIALTGDDSEELREDAINRLEKDKGLEKLEYIFTVDIFNEGIDIPKVNQIILLRPTQSAIVFVQQLGRGLRKTEGKEYLTVIDFIGNYQSNYLIPVALYGDSTYNKDKLRRLLSGGSAEIPGASTVNFDLISKERIFRAIDAANMSLKKDLDRDYTLLKFKIGSIPLMMDFVEHGTRDPFLYVSYAKSYFNYIEQKEDAYKNKLNSTQKKFLEVFANEIANGKRFEELFLVMILLEKREIDAYELLRLSETCELMNPLDKQTISSVYRNLNLQFVKEALNKKRVTVSEKYGIITLDEVIFNSFGKVVFDSNFALWLENQYFKAILIDNINYAVYTYKEGFDREKYNNGFVLYKKYTRKDVFRILNWDENPVAQNVGGYMISKDKSNCAIFVNYHKDEEISNTTKYEDKFLTPELFQWMSKSKRTMKSPDVIAITKFEINSMRLPLFIKKHNDEGAAYYYMGDVEPIPEMFENEMMSDDNGKNVSVVKMIVRLLTPVSQEMYGYIREK